MDTTDVESMPFTGEHAPGQVCAVSFAQDVREMLREHVVGSKILIPGVGYLEFRLASQACVDGGAACVLTDL